MFKILSSFIKSDGGICHFRGYLRKLAILNPIFHIPKIMKKITIRYLIVLM